MSVVAPCPFCGSNDIARVAAEYADRVSMLCLSCDASGPPVSRMAIMGAPNSDQAAVLVVDAWNRRA